MRRFDLLECSRPLAGRCDRRAAGDGTTPSQGGVDSGVGDCRADMRQALPDVRRPSPTTGESVAENLDRNAEVAKRSQRHRRGRRNAEPGDDCPRRAMRQPIETSARTGVGFVERRFRGRKRRSTTEPSTGRPVGGAGRPGDLDSATVNGQSVVLTGGSFRVFGVTAFRCLCSSSGRPVVRRTACSRGMAERMMPQRIS